MSFLEQYRKLEKDLIKQRIKTQGYYSHDEDNNIEEMTEVWYKLTEQEQDLIYAEGAKALNIQAREIEGNPMTNPLILPIGIQVDNLFSWYDDKGTYIIPLITDNKVIDGYFLSYTQPTSAGIDVWLIKKEDIPKDVIEVSNKFIEYIEKRFELLTIRNQNGNYYSEYENDTIEAMDDLWSNLTDNDAKLIKSQASWKFGPPP
jgi:hypothetical protein